MKPFLSVYGHIIMDTIIDSPKAPGNEEFVGVEDFHRRYGGTGANLAMGAARLGTPVALHAFIGGDFPEDYRKRLESAEIDLSNVIQVEGKSPRVWVVNTPDGQRGYVFQGVMGDMQAYSPTYPHKESKWVHFSTGRPGYYIPIARGIKEKKIGFDPGQEIHYVYDARSLADMLSCADIFFCNESELERAMSMLGLNHHNELLDYVPMVVNTLGSKGSRILSDRGEEKIPAMPANVADQTGAGDAYRAGFYTALHRNASYIDAGFFASAVSSIVIEGYGAQEPLPDIDEVRKRLKAQGYEVRI